MAAAARRGTIGAVPPLRSACSRTGGFPQVLVPASFAVGGPRRRFAASTGGLAAAVHGGWKATAFLHFQSAGSPTGLGRNAKSSAAVAVAAAVAAGSVRGVATEAVQRPELVEGIPTEVALSKSTIRLYQFESCPFCRKVRSCLDYRKVPYEIVEVHPLNKNETKEIAPDYKKVPILRVESEDGRSVQLRDSKTIVLALLLDGPGNPGVSTKVPPPSATQSTGKMWPPKDEALGTIEEQWVRWTDVVLVQCIVLNVYRTLSESAETFRYLLTHPNFPWFAARSAAWSGTAVMWAVAKSRKRKFGVPDERLALYEALESFGDAVRVGGDPFLGGSSPGAVDFNVFGILRSAEGCQTERDFREKCPSILPWYDSMCEVVGPTCASNAGDVKRGM